MRRRQIARDFTELRSRLDVKQFERYLMYRDLFELLALIATTPANAPIRVPARNRREVYSVLQRAA
jgi:hypothetical protein